ncbi:hypothetical protein OK016_13785 [Vibrio chagasii]|nr:hypothetical protein [Vibrio chagasii]
MLKRIDHDTAEHQESTSALRVSPLLSVKPLCGSLMMRKITLSLDYPMVGLQTTLLLTRKMARRCLGRRIQKLRLVSTYSAKLDLHRKTPRKMLATKRRHFYANV